MLDPSIAVGGSLDVRGVHWADPVALHPLFVPPDFRVGLGAMTAGTGEQGPDKIGAGGPGRAVIGDQC